VNIALMATSALQLLGERIRARRLERGLTQERLAEMSDLHNNHISAIERGITNPTFLALLRIARALDTPITDILSPFTLASMRRLPLN
jgi:transcriptional regulator with XRE-family HTH domain